MKNNFYFIFYITLFLTVINISPSFGQTSAWGNYEIYNRKTSFSSIGYMTTHLSIVDTIGLSAKYFQTGIYYSNEYTLGNLSRLVIDENNEINLSFMGTFRVGLGQGIETDSNKTYIVNNNHHPATYYALTIDLFTMDLAADYTIILNNGYAILFRFQFGLIDLGGTAGILSGGYFNNNGIGVASIIPFSFKPSFYLDFGRSILGFGLFYNPRNLLDYSFSANNQGLKFNDYTVQRYGIQISFSF